MDLLKRNKDQQKAAAQATSSYNNHSAADLRLENLSKENRRFDRRISSFFSSMFNNNRKKKRGGSRGGTGADSSAVVAGARSSSPSINTNYLSFNNEPSGSATNSNGNNNNTNNSGLQRQQQQQPQLQQQQQRDPLSTATSIEACDHRGFSTSIFDLFSNPDNERVDCCALTCCGVLQSDRDRYLLNGVTPPGFFKRCTVHVLTPLGIFLLAGLVATHVTNTLLNQIASTVLVLMLIIYLCSQCAKGRSKRIGIRKDLLYLKYQIQQQNHPEGARLLNLLETHRPRNGSNDEDEFGDHGEEFEPYYLGQSRSDFRRSHPCCLLGLYADDRHPANDKSPENNRNGTAAAASSLLGSEDNNDYELSPDLCRRLYTSVCSCSLCTSWWCCSSRPRGGGGGIRTPALCCGMHVQTCGLCALAQEAREVENVLLPPSYRRIDYVTMQAVTDYYPAIYRAKYRIDDNNNNEQNAAPASTSGRVTAVIQLLPGGGQTVIQQPRSTSPSQTSSSKAGFLRKHLPPLSRLSFRLIQSLGIVTCVLAVWSILGPLYWKFIVRTRNLSHAFSFWDFLIYLATVLQAVVLLALITWFIGYKQRRQGTAGSDNDTKPKSDLSYDAMIKYFFSGFFLSTSIAVFWELLGAFTVRAFVSLLLAIFGVDAREDPSDSSSSYAYDYDDYSTDQGDSEEFNDVKYLRALLLPSAFDWSSGAEMSSTKTFMEAFGNDHPVIYTFYILFGAFCLAALIEELSKYFGYRMVEHPDFLSKRDLDEAHKIIMGENGNGDQHEEDEFDVEEDVSPRSRGRNNAASRGRTERILAPPDYSMQRQSMQAQGAAITLAMISVAMGFSCCENLVYVFLYSSSSPKMELAVLISRSLFAVHPIAAALQSIGVCKRELEGSRVTKLGRIILPAVAFHGSYDFFILWIDFLAKRHGIYAGGDGNSAFDEGSVVAIAVSFVVSLLMVCIALIYLYRECNAQRSRLADMDRQNSVDRSRLI